MAKDHGQPSPSVIWRETSLGLVSRLFVQRWLLLLLQRKPPEKNQTPRLLPANQLASTVPSADSNLCFKAVSVAVEYRTFCTHRRE